MGSEMCIRDRVWRRGAEAPTNRGHANTGPLHGEAVGKSDAAPNTHGGVTFPQGSRSRRATAKVTPAGAHSFLLPLKCARCSEKHYAHGAAGWNHVLSRYTAVQHIADKAKLLRKEARGMQHMVMKDEVRSAQLYTNG